MIFYKKNLSSFNEVKKKKKKDLQLFKCNNKITFQLISHMKILMLHKFKMIISINDMYTSELM